LQDSLYVHISGSPGHGPEYDDFLPGMSPYSRPPKRRRAGRIAVMAIAAAAVTTVIAGVVIVKVLPHQEGKNTAGFHPTADSPPGDAEQIAATFLRAWSSGNLSEAAGLTDDPTVALDALTAYRQDLNLRKLTGTVTGTATASAPAVPAGMSAAGASASTTIETVTFALNATVADSASPSAASGTWSYHSALTPTRYRTGPAGSSSGCPAWWRPTWPMARDRPPS
jgi:hypothetical protein